MQQGNVAVDSTPAHAKGSVTSLMELGQDGRPAQLHQPGGRIVASVVSDRPNPPQRPRRPTGVRVRILPVSRVKVTPAPVRETTLARERLLDWLDAHIDRRLVSIVAETGYGKTTLLADFCRRTAVRCLWYKLDVADVDPPAFISYVVAAAREFIPDFGEDTVSALENTLESGQPWDRALAALIDDLASFEGRRTALVLDDYHLVDEAPEIRSILTALLRSAPADFGLVLLTRRRPRLPLGRLVAQGEVAEMTTADLRFTIEETARLFRETYRQPLDPEVLEEVEARTEGWAASLQLLRSTIRGRSPAEVRAVVRAMSGAEGPVYEYLAQEVVGGLSPELQRFVTLTSILDNVTIDLAVAIFAADQNPPRRSTLEFWAREADEVGLLTRHSTVETSQRYHPLLRDLLLRRLRQKLPETALRAMHLRVARTAEPTDWLVACHHYIEAGERSEASRVLAANADRTLGSGQWGDAAALVRALEVSDEDPRIAVIMARDDVYSGRVDQALARLDRFDLAALDGADRGLVAQGRIHALLSIGRVSEVAEIAGQIAADNSIPDGYRTIARYILLVAETTTTGSLGRAEAELEAAAGRFESDSQHFFAAITLHNLLWVQIALGQFNRAVTTAERALRNLGATPGPTSEARSVSIGAAYALFELGLLDEAGLSLDRAIGDQPSGATEEYLLAATLLTIMGDRRSSEELIARASAMPDAANPQNRFAAMVARARLALADGRIMDASDALGTSYEQWPATVPAAWLTWVHLRAMVDALSGDPISAAARIKEGEALSLRQHSWLFLQRFRLLANLTGDDPWSAAQALASATEATLLASAEIIVAQLGRLDPTPPCLRESLSRRPSRWLPLLRRALREEQGAGLLAAARLLNEFGELQDVRPLRALSRAYKKDLKGTDLGRNLVRLRSPRIHIEDLGRTEFSVGERTVIVSTLRRKAAAVLCFLLSRPGLMATKDQVLDALWPDLDPAAALNSLNQTLYFLRRDIDPGFDDDCSAHYVKFEGELLWLDRELTEVQSATFYDTATRALAANTLEIQVGQTVLELYSGRFAPEFEYDDWAIGWRETLHALYLHLAESVTRGLVQGNCMSQAVDVVLHVLGVDPDAERFERSLIWLYGNLGARSAAAEQYAHYTSIQRRDYGVEPPSLDELIEAPLGNPAY